MQRRESDNQQHGTKPEKASDRSSSHEQRPHIFSATPLLRKPVEFELVRHRGDNPG
jgi:hypothetical protein